MSRPIFKSLSSGSCGNCYFFGLADESCKVEAGILIDAGVSVRRLKDELSRVGTHPEDISGVLVTHDHFDHIRSLGSYCKRVGFPVWTTDVLASALRRRQLAGECFQECSRILREGEWNDIVPGRISAKYFVVPHDATQTVGFAIRMDDYRITLMTDIGSMTPESLAFAAHSDTVIIESNYDLEMLMNGSYTYDLKMRIRNGSGHLRNEECAEAVRAFMHPGLRHVFLCHLSENNNTPEKAFAATAAVFDELGVRDSVSLRALPRNTASPLFHL